MKVVAPIEARGARFMLQCVYTAILPITAAQLPTDGSCPMATLANHLAAISDTCCPPGACLPGAALPDACDASCGEIFLPFFDECANLLSAIGMVGMNSYSDFASSCEGELSPASCGHGCTSTNYQCRMEEAETACCVEDFGCGTSDGGLSSLDFCGYECSLVLPAFVDDCANFFDDMAGSLAQIRDTCYSQDVSMLLDRAHTLIYVERCAVDLSTVLWGGSYSGTDDGSTPTGDCSHSDVFISEVMEGSSNNKYLPLRLTLLSCTILQVTY